MDLIKQLINAGEKYDVAFHALALSMTPTHTVNQIVLAILNHPNSDAPRWVKGEKGCGKKAGQAKSLKTIRDENPKDWRNFRFAHEAQRFESNATHYKQTDKKKFVRASAGTTEDGTKLYALVPKKHETTDERKKRKAKEEQERTDNGTTNASDSTVGINLDLLSADMQVFIDSIRADMNPSIREALLALTGKHDIKVTIPVAK